MAEEKKGSHAYGFADSIEDGVKLAAPQPGGVLSLVSSQYDTTGKGYLDPTEKALRRMDSTNLGYLTPDKVYKIMEQLQEEHTRSHELIRELHEQRDKALSLKKAVYALIGFSVLLALSNIGTSFAAARLAKDTSIEGIDMVAVGTNSRVATTPKYVEIMFTPVEESRRKLRHLQEDLTSQVCADIDTSTTACEIQPEVSLADAKALYTQFCPNYPTWTDATPPEQRICSGGVSQLTINCVGETTNILGGINFPASPTPIEDGGLLAFPAFNYVFNANQVKVQTASLSSTLVAMPAGEPCEQAFRFALYCYTEQDSCIPFITYTQEALCPWIQGSPQLCNQAISSS